MNKQTFLCPSFPSFLAKGACLIVLLALGGCASLSPSGNPNRQAIRDGNALGEGYCPGCNMPARLSKIN